MTIEECYQSLGGDYADVIDRLSNPELVEKFIAKFLEDDSFTRLCTEIGNANCEEAFRAAHTLKGICQNLSFSRLLASTEPLVELLRSQGPSVPENVAQLLENVKRDYEMTVSAIRMYLNQCASR